MRLLSYIVIVAAAIFTLTACVPHTVPAPYPGDQPTQDLGKEESPQALLDTVYKLGPGDRIKITVFGEKDLSGEFPIDGSGNISFPLIGEIVAKGFSVHELEQNLQKKLQNGYLISPRVSVEVLNYRPFYILGEVKKPGQYEYVNGLTLYNAVAIAGGYTYRARRNQARITRVVDGNEVILEADHSTLILPGDVINIRERFF